MSQRQDEARRHAALARAQMISLLRDAPDPNHLVLAPDEIRLLALILITQNGVEPFVEKMLALSESVKAGRRETFMRLAGRSKDHTLNELLAPMAQAAVEGRVVAVCNTAFLAASFAYQNSFDCMRELLKYIDRCRRRA